LRTRSSAWARLAAAHAPSPGVSRRSGDSCPAVRGRSSVPPDPFGVSTPFGFSPAGPSGRPKPSGAPHALSCPFRGSSTQPRAALPGVEARLQRFLSWTSSPYGTLSGGRPRSMPTDPSVGARHVRGLDTPIAAAATTLPAREAPERPWACPFKALLPVSGGAPPGATALLTLAAAPPCGDGQHARLQGLALVTGRARGPKTTSPSLPGVHPSRALPPVRPGHRLWSRRRPSHPRAG
jgi:hypothetical protein